MQCNSGPFIFHISVEDPYSIFLSIRQHFVLSFCFSLKAYSDVNIVMIPGETGIKPFAKSRLLWNSPVTNELLMGYNFAFSLFLCCQML